MAEEIEFVEGSGNVFDDLGLTNPEERLAKAELLLALKNIIEERGLTQEEVAGMCDVDQPTISKALRGKMKSISLERLTLWITCLACSRFSGHRSRSLCPNAVLSDFSTDQC